MKPVMREFKGKKPEIGKNNYIDECAILIGSVKTGDNVSIWPGAVLRGDTVDIVIGDNTSFQDNCIAHGYKDVIIGKNVTVGHGCVLHGPKIADNVLVGMGSTLLDDCEIGEFSIIGANSLVTGGKKFPPKSLIMGSPAKRIREVTPEEIEYIKQSYKDYLNLLKEVTE